MAKMKKVLMLALVFVLTAALTLGGTVAYLQDEDSDVNVMTLGNVSITQNEQQRAADGSLEEFKQLQVLYPYVTLGKTVKETVTVNDYAIKMRTKDSVGNYMDKIVSVTNDGKSDAYVRTLIAIPAKLENEDASKNILHWNAVSDTDTEPSNGWYWNIEEDKEWGAKVYATITVGNVDYNVYVATNKNVLKAGESTAPSLVGVYLDKNVDCDGSNYTMNGEKIDYDFSEGVKILVLSQAVQTQGFADAATALETAFPKGDNNANIPGWFTGMDFPEIFTYEDVNYVTVGDTATVTSAGGNTVYRGILSDSKTTVANVVIGEGITILNDRSLCKAPTITSVTLPSSLTYIDESVFQQSGITEIEIPENVTYIGKQAFGACGSLEKIVIKAKDVTIGNYAARACANLKEVYIYSDSVAFEHGSMYFTNKENADASGITFYVKDKNMADTLYNAFSTSHSYGLLIKDIDGATTYYNTLK